LVENETTDEENSDEITASGEETVILWVLTIALPLIIVGVATGIILLAFSGWKLY
jgi:hypothetical protein